jgi:hypothetical protein
LKSFVDKGSSSKGNYQPPFRRQLPNPPNRSNLPAEGLSLEGLHHAIRAILDRSDIFVVVPPRNQNDAENEDEETPNEGDSSPPVFGNLLDTIFQANFEFVLNDQHPYNTHSKSQNKYVLDVNRNTISKQSRQVET